MEVRDSVTRPQHYIRGKYEVIDMINSILNSMDLSSYQGYLLGNTLKYISRFANKNGVEDLEKAKMYLIWLIKDYEKVGD